MLQPEQGTPVLTCLYGQIMMASSPLPPPSTTSHCDTLFTDSTISVRFVASPVVKGGHSCQGERLIYLVADWCASGPLVYTTPD